jgi:hypothetical protein
MKMWFFAATLLIIALDQVSKWWIQWHLAPGQSVPVVPGVLQFTLSFQLGHRFRAVPAVRQGVPVGIARAGDGSTGLLPALRAMPAHGRPPSPVFSWAARWATFGIVCGWGM